jgi:hypothetical protein
MCQNYLSLRSTSPFLLDPLTMTLPVPLSTLSGECCQKLTICLTVLLTFLLVYVTVGHATAKCSACRDNFGRPLSFSKNSVRRHLDSATHLANVKTLTTAQKKTAVKLLKVELLTVFLVVAHAGVLRVPAQELKRM